MSADVRPAGAPSASADGAPALPAHGAQDVSSDQLVRSARDRAFAEVAEHRSYLYAFMRAQGMKWDTADDLVSLVIERYARRRQEVPVERVQSYLKVMARNAIIDHQKGRHREILIGEPQELDQILEAERPADHVVADSFAAQELMLKISSLSPTMQTVIRLLYFDGLSVAQVAHRLKMTQATVSTHRYRAVRRLRELYGQASARDAQEAAVIGRGAS
ncbi:RNA polymerase sigma factor [Streptomyces cinereoruber]|uniref:RNA polymerase sigma factor n=1 Tax=Streptomyces cinereoruber TaxID=67260 RepID=UPI0036315CF9